MTKRRKWLYWIACAVVLLGAAAALIIFTLPKKDVIPAVKIDPGARLSELSEDDCIAFVNNCGISVPSELNNADLGKFIKEAIVQFEKDPYSAVAYEYGSSLRFSEDIRRAVNKHYGVPMLEYGTYEFEKCLYMTPISSYYPFDGTNEKYIVNDNGLLIAKQVYPNTNEHYAVSTWRVQPVDLTTWNEKFQMADPIDISGYTYRSFYTVGTHALFVMDGEVWLATLDFRSNTFWSVYKLKLAE